MAVDTKLTDLATATSFDAASWFLLVDPTVTTMDASGTDLKIQAGDLIKGLLPSQTGNSGKVLSTNGTGTLSWIVASGGGGSGTVTSVALTVPPWLNVSGSPVTTAGTLAITLDSGQSANRVLATPDGVTGAVAIRALVAADIPNLPAAQITSGTVATARLGTGTANATKFLQGDQTWQTLNQAAVTGLTTADSPTFTGLTVGSATGLLKRTSGTLASAVAGTDYEPAITAGTTAQYLKGDKSLGTLNQAAVAGLTTASSPAFAGLTVGSLSGLLKAASGVVSAATAGTDYLTTSYAGTSSIVTVGTITSGTWTGTTIAIANGGTGQTSASAAFNALSPLTTLGDVLYASGANTNARLAGNTSGTKKYLTQTGTGSVSAAPAWGTIAAADVPTMVASGASHAPGIVPDPPSSAGATKFLREDATWAIPAGGGGSADNLGLTPTAVKTAGYTAAAGNFVPCDSTSGGFTVTLPTAPADGTVIAVKHVAQGGANAITVACGGSDVINRAGGPTSTSLSSLGRGVILQYNSSLAVWYVMARDLGTVLGGDVSTGQVAIANGGTGQATSTAAFNALSPNTTLGDITYGDGANSSNRLAGNTTATRKFLRQTGTGTVSAAPAWDTILAADVPAAGSTGQIQYNSSAALAGASNLTVGSSGQLTFGQISDPGSPAAGDLWVDSVQKVPSFVSSGMIARAGGIVWQGLSSGTSVANTTTQTSVLAGISTSLGSLTFPANSLKVGTIIKPEIWCLTTVTGTPTIQWIVLIGGSTVFSFTSAALAATAQNQFAGLLPMTALQVQSVGASGKILGFVWVYQGSSTTVSSVVAGTASANQTTTFGAPQQATVDTTVSNTFDVQVKWSVANASNKVQFMGGKIAVEG